MNSFLLYAFTVTLLSASGGLAALSVFGKAGTPVWLDRLVVGGALLCAGLLLYSHLFQADGMHFGFAIASMCVAWLAAMVAFVESFFNRVPILEMLVFPLAAVVFLLPLLGVEEPLTPMSGDFLFQLHLLIALSAYSLLGIAAVHAMVMAYQEKALHGSIPLSSEGRALRERLLDQLPPLLVMESILFRQIWAGFALLSLTLITGFWFAEQWFGRAFYLNHKTLFALLSWLSFAVLLFGRAFSGWRGKRALRWCVGSYAVLVLAYFGTQFVLEFVLKRVA